MCANASVTDSQWPRSKGRVLLVVALGGFAGGLARYGIDRAWPSAANAFPWATFAVNTSGTFALALIIVVVLRAAPSSRYLRPTLGAGFCGAYTTFSGVVVAADELTAHGHGDIAAAYVVASLAAGLAAAAIGATLGRVTTTARR